MREVKNRYLQIVLIFFTYILIFFLISFILAQLGISESSGVLGNIMNSLFRIVFAVLSVIFLCVFVFKKNLKEIIKLMGIKKSNLLRSTIIGLLFFIGGAIIYLIISMLVSFNQLNISLTFSNIGGFFLGYFESWSIGTSFIEFGISLLFLFGLIVQLIGVLGEEIITRGLTINILSPQNKLKKLIIAILIGSIFFAFLHIANIFYLDYNNFSQYFLYFTEKFISGIIFSICFIVSKRNIMGVVLYHFLLNLTNLGPQALLYSFS